VITLDEEDEERGEGGFEVDEEEWEQWDDGREQEHAKGTAVEQEELESVRPIRLTLPFLLEFTFSPSRTARNGARKHRLADPQPPPAPLHPIQSARRPSHNHRLSSSSFKIKKLFRRAETPDWRC
jgi:hypothetical protein